MRNSERSKVTLRSLQQLTVAGACGDRPSGEVPCASRDHIEDDIGAWIADLTAVTGLMRHEMGSDTSGRLSEARERLERLGGTLRQAPGRIAEHVRQRTAELAATSQAQLDRLGEHEASERSLTAANAQLRRDIAEHAGLEAERREEERCLREAGARFESAFEHSPIGMALLAMDGRWLQVNDALCRIMGLIEDELRATTLRAMTHPDDIDLDTENLRQLLDGRIPSYQVEMRYRHAWGHDVWVMVTASLVRDESMSPLHIVTQVQDISGRKELARRLEYLVDHDFLTGLFNRRHFELELAKEVERVERYGAHGAVLLIDLDNFKTVNDTFGHKAGDDVLKGVAGLLRQRMRHTDVVARVGGDEFAVLVPRVTADQAMIVADEVVKALGRQSAVQADQSIHITASIGVAMFDGLTDTEVLASADLAMYEAKETGRNRFVMYRRVAGRRDRVSTRHAEAERIRSALEEDRLILYCQPILDLRKNEVSQYELLLRLPNEKGGEPLAPNAFLYVAERFGLIQAIDGWVVRKAIALIAEHERAGRKLVLNVNLSGKSIGDRKLAALIEEALSEAKIDAASLILELTETAAIANIEEAKIFAARLRGQGCQFALDDFGAGFGSFFYLKTFPFEYLKIDGEFIRGLATSPMDQLVVEAIVRIAHGMGKKTIAEFVGDAEAARLLYRFGVDYAQGYHIGQPRPVSDVLRTRPMSVVT